MSAHLFLPSQEHIQITVDTCYLPLDKFEIVMRSGNMLDLRWILIWIGDVRLLLSGHLTLTTLSSGK